MNGFKKCSFACVIVLLVLLPMVFVSVNAQEAEIVDSGKCGDNLTWTLDSSGILVISGSGDMYDAVLPDDEMEKVIRYGDVFPSKLSTTVKSVILQEGVTSVGNHAFSYFWVKDIVLPSTLAHIGDYAFYRTDIREFVFPQNSNLKTIGKGAFESLSMLRKADFSNCALLEGIPDNCFYDSRELSELILPESISFKYIGKSAFEQCKKLSQVALPDSINSIADRAFAKCKSLISISLPQALDSAGNEIFDGCGAMAVFGKADSDAKDVAKKNNVSFVEGNSTDNAVVLRQGTCGENASWALYSDGKLVISGKGEMQQYPSVTYVPWYSSCDSVTALVVEEGITHISREAFANHDRLKSISLPNSLLTIADYAFISCRDLTEIVIPENVYSIGTHAFYYNTAVKRIYIPASVEFIGEYAFYEPYSLEAFEVSPDNGFFSSEGGVLFNKEKTRLIAYPIGRTDTAYTVPAGVNSIAFRAFASAYALEEIDFSVGCSVTQLEGNVFEDCVSLKSVKLNDGMKRIGNRVFAGCKSLVSVEIPDTVTEIGINAFSSTSVKSIILPGVVHIGDRAFSSCDKLESISIPSAQIIGEEAFVSCSEFKSIDIPKSVSFIGTNAFLWNDNLQSINVATENAYYRSDEHGVLYTSDMTQLIKYPAKSSLTEYTVPETVEYINEYAFSTANNLESVKLPSKLVSIGRYSFTRCETLSEISLPRTLSSLGIGAFSGCLSLKTINIPEDTELSRIEKSVFSGIGASEFKIPAPISSIGEYAIAGENLESITVSENTKLSYIAYGAFGGQLKFYVPQGSSAEQAAIKAGVAYNYTNPITVIVNGQTLCFDQNPVIENDRVLVPMRAIFEALGAEVAWEHETYTAVAVKGDITVSIGIGKSALVKNGESIDLDSPAKLVTNRTMVPVRAVSEAFGCNVEWDENTRTVSVTSE